MSARLAPDADDVRPAGTVGSWRVAAAASCVEALEDRRMLDGLSSQFNAAPGTPHNVIAGVRAGRLAAGSRPRRRCRDSRRRHRGRESCMGRVLGSTREHHAGLHLRPGALCAARRHVVDARTTFSPASNLPAGPALDVFTQLVVGQPERRGSITPYRRQRRRREQLDASIGAAGQRSRRSGLIRRHGPGVGRDDHCSTSISFMFDFDRTDGITAGQIGRRRSSRPTRLVTYWASTAASTAPDANDGQNGRTGTIRRRMTLLPRVR